MCLLDTDVVSELDQRSRPNLNVRRWYEHVSDNALFVSALVVGELRDGIERLRPRDPVRAHALERWFEGQLLFYADRILPIDSAVAQRWGRMNARNRLPTIDSLMAATAAVHGLTLVTRNVRDIARTGIKFLNPFEG
jgi:toxin FitB